MFYTQKTRMSSVVRVLILDTVLAFNVPKIAKVKYTLKKTTT